MTKKDYKRAVELIVETRQERMRDDSGFWDAIPVLSIEDVTQLFVTFFRSNPKFDETKFYNAVGFVNPPKHVVKRRKPALKVVK